LHRGERKELLELVTGKAEKCDKLFLRNIGFHPNGDEYWFFRIKQVIKNDSVFSSIVREAKVFKHSPHIVSVGNNVG
jgi:DNA (cytosine-5)-methyltransferase 1